VLEVRRKAIETQELEQNGVTAMVEPGYRMSRP
jgi:hypothetical protein